MGRSLAILAAAAGALTRGHAGGAVVALGPRPARPLVLFDVAGCPYCRPVREALCMLDLDVLVYPTPVGGTRFVADLEERAGRTSVPYLVDPNEDVALGEADDIVHHLFRFYGVDGTPAHFDGARARLTSPVARALRGSRGTHARPSREPRRPLELWYHEACPYGVEVRDTLTELELPHLVHPAAHGSAHLAPLRAAAGRVAVPYLHDPNTGMGLFEGHDIAGYLERTYALD